MTREEFIQESAMRNMHALINKLSFTASSDITKYRDRYATTAIGLANAMADYLFECDAEDI